jgi:Fur family ferric uptake transcriptional regulator
MQDGTGPPWLHGKFRGCGYRLTVPRQAILDLLSNTTEHLSAEDIYIKVHKVSPTIGLTTVYRTLELLVKAGLVMKFDFGDGRARFEIIDSQQSNGHHHHLICTECGRIIDYQDFIDEELELLKQTEKGLSKKYNFKIANHILQFQGICDKCQKKMK